MRSSTIRWTAAAFAACLTLAGCSREEDTRLPARPEGTATAPVPAKAPGPSGAPTTPPPAEESHTGILEAPGAYVQAVVNAKLTAETKIWLTEARERIKAFEVNNDRHPKDLAEAAGGFPFHQLPAGMEWQYDPNTGEIDIVAPPGK